MRRNSMKLTALAAVALVGAAAGVNCSKGSTSNSGDVKLAVVLPSGDTISTVTYTILNSGGTAIAGPSPITVTDPRATISLDIVVPVTPAGDAGDRVTLTATATGTGGVTESCTGTSPAFPVVAGTNTPVMMTLTCGTGTQSNQTGNVGITATLVEGDNCPNINSVVVGPDETSVGSSVSVVAVGSDADASETVSYAWAPAANFVTPTAASTSYRCTVSGTQTFTVTVSDNHLPTPCTTVATLTIKCDMVNTCGNGVIEPGETCEPPNTATCSSTCQTITAATGGTTGTAGAPATGGTTGTGGVAGTTGAAGAPATGGVTGTGGTGTGGTGTGGTGTGGMFAEDAPACVACETSGTTAGSCVNTVASGALASPGAVTGCDGLASATDRANCLALLTCLRGTTCQNLIRNASADYYESAQGFIDPFPCLCNSTTAAITSNACNLLSSWSGVCAPQYMAATPSNLLGEFYGNATPAGIATNLMACDISAPCTSQATCRVPQ